MPEHSTPIMNPNGPHVDIALPNPAVGAGQRTPRTAVLELGVRNHPGTMSHITGLFARRAFNLEAIVCAPDGDGRTSTILLLVADEPRLAQLERELAKLYDVLTVKHRSDIAPEYFARCIGTA